MESQHSYDELTAVKVTQQYDTTDIAELFNNDSDIVTEFKDIPKSQKPIGDYISGDNEEVSALRELLLSQEHGIVGYTSQFMYHNLPMGPTGATGPSLPMGATLPIQNFKYLMTTMPLNLHIINFDNQQKECFIKINDRCKHSLEYLLMHCYFGIDASVTKVHIQLSCESLFIKVSVRQIKISYLQYKWTINLNNTGMTPFNPTKDNAANLLFKLSKFQKDPRLCSVIDKFFSYSSFTSYSIYQFLTKGWELLGDSPDAAFVINFNSLPKIINLHHINVTNPTEGVLILKNYIADKDQWLDFLNKIKMIEYPTFILRAKKQQIYSDNDYIYIPFNFIPLKYYTCQTIFGDNNRIHNDSILSLRGLYHVYQYIEMLCANNDLEELNNLVKKWQISTGEVAFNQQSVGLDKQRLYSCLINHLDNID